MGTNIKLSGVKEKFVMYRIYKITSLYTHTHTYLRVYVNVKGDEVLIKRDTLLAEWRTVIS